LIPLLVDLETEWRGGQNQALLLLRGLYERGHAAELIAAEGSALGRRARAAGIYVHSISRGGFRLPAAAKIREVMNSGRIELVHANEAHAVTAAWLAGAHRRVPFLISRRVGYPLGKSWLSRARYHAADCIIANSQWVGDQAAASGAPSEKLRVVYEGANIPERITGEQRENARKHWSVLPNEPLLGCVGVLSSDKGQQWLIRALVEVRKKFPDAKLILAGDGPCRAELEMLTNELGLTNSVIFAGFVKDVASVYAALDVFLLPSFFEAFNNSLLSAMASEIPSIVFQRGALTEIVENGRSGLVVSGPDVPEISVAVERLLSDRSLAKQLARAGRQRVAQNFTAERMIDSTLQIYEEVLGNYTVGAR
jgi:glycosyltransferase involved in cell wall biosynthesis